VELEAPSPIPLNDASQLTESDDVAYELIEDCTIFIVEDSNNITKLPKVTWIYVVGSSDSNNTGF
jgi:hypothetical protein